ncbi:type IV secretion system protein [Burkholderia sp. Ac-20345]|uniref:type IV secretion system protein n=1 Tax=Burkholderia sp. Ac-20345 TaxID=2703891 RepID=UPI00197C6204|nr:type IV secretion system protein [Burkholderia sp. Ac-20345]MBN3780517.1 type IV secretion system protein [Burkholderia sp. Ac-20345]
MSTGIFNFIGGTLENALVTFANTTSANLAGAITPLVVSCLTIWVYVYGWAVLRGEVHEPVGQFVWKAVKIGLILGFALGAGTYQTAAIQGANSLANGLAQVFNPGSSSVYDALDALNDQAGQIVMTLMDRGQQSMPWGGYSDVLAAIIMLLGGIVVLLVAGGFVMLAKVFLYFVLSVGPIFIATLAFPPVAKFFDGWLSKIVNYVLLLAFAAGLCGLYLVLCKHFFTLMGDESGSTNALADAGDFLLAACLMALLARQLPAVTAGLAGGSAIGGAGSFIAGMLLGSRTSSPPTPPAPDAPSGGGSVDNNGGSSSPTNSPTPSSSTPAYRRSTMEHLAKSTSTNS